MLIDRSLLRSPLEAKSLIRPSSPFLWKSTALSLREVNEGRKKRHRIFEAGLKIRGGNSDGGKKITRNFLKTEKEWMKRNRRCGKMNEWV